MYRYINKLAVLSGLALVSMAASCQDTEGKFNLYNGEERGCFYARKNPWKNCQKDVVRDNCPVTCNACPGDVQCNIRAELKFVNPKDPDFVGYHSDRVQVEKVGSDEICGPNRFKFGCRLKKTSAHLSGNPDGSVVKESQIVQIFGAAGATYKMTVGHRFSDEEKLSATRNGVQRAQLQIGVNGDQRGKTFRHKLNKNKKPYENAGEDDWHINPLYNGDYFVEIACSDACDCKIVKKEATCSLKIAVYHGKTDV